MSQPPNTATYVQEDAPCPWLTVDTEQEGLPRQQWNPEIEEQTYFTAHFQPSRQDHWRCHRRILWVRPYFTFTLLGATLFYGIMVQLIGYGLTCIYSKKMMPLTGKTAIAIFVLPVSAVIGVAITAMIFQSAVTLGRLWEIRARKTLPYKMTVTSSYIECDAFPKTTKLLWKEVAAVVLNHGDLYVIGPKFDSGFYVPRHAFGDTASTEMLRDAIYSLWKNNGHPDALSVEAQRQLTNGDLERK